MMTEEFATPSPPGDSVTWADHKGCLMMIEVLSFEGPIETVHGTSDAVRANVSVLDGFKAGHTYNDALIFPTVLVSQTRSQIGKKVLGRLNQTVAKAGKNAAWSLDAATPADVEVAKAFVARAPITAAAAPASSGLPPF